MLKGYDSGKRLQNLRKLYCSPKFYADRTYF